MRDLLVCIGQELTTENDIDNGVMEVAVVRVFLQNLALVIFYIKLVDIKSHITRRSGGGLRTLQAALPRGKARCLQRTGAPTGPFPTSFPQVNCAQP